MNSTNTYDKDGFRTVELTVNRQTIVDKYAELLAAIKVTLPNEEVTNIQFKDLFGTSAGELVPIKVFVKNTGNKESTDAPLARRTVH